MSHQIFNSCRKIIGAGVNYKEILKITNSPKPDSPVIFFKPISSLICDDGDIFKQEQNVIKIPKIFNEINFEAELGVIIGEKCDNVTTDNALNYVAGYCLALDMTGMDFIIDARKKGLPWCLGKGFDTSTPVSQFLSKEAIKDPNNVNVWCKINGELKQNDSTQNLIFSIAELISYISKYMTLEPNDLILTGTPAGAGAVKEGDIINCGLQNIIEMQFKIVKSK